MAVAQPAVSFYVTTPVLRPLLLGLRTLGVDLSLLLAEVGLSLDTFSNPDTRIEPEKALQLVRAAVRMTGDDNLGLRLAQLYQPGVFGTLDYLAHSAATLGQAIEALCRYERIHQNGMRTTLEIDGERASIRHTMLHPYALPRQVSESNLANLIVIGRRLTGSSFNALEIRLSHARPLVTEAHQLFFGCPIQWGAPFDEVIIDRELLASPVLGHNPQLAGVLDGFARELLVKLGVEPGLREQVSEQILLLLPRAEASLGAVARRLAVSPRTLQRQLQADGLGFADLLEEVRRGMAEVLMKQQTLGMEDIALLLGFSDTRAFRRSFQRWMGVSPSGYRKRVAGK